MIKITASEKANYNTRNQKSNSASQFNHGFVVDDVLIGFVVDDVLIG